MPEEMIPEMVDAYGQAAAKLKGAGFEMLVIHGGYGWLLHRFISPLDNKRKDKYSGTLKNRARIPLMVIDSVRKAVSPGFPIEYRISGDEFREGGYKLQDGIEFARLIDGKVDLIHVSAAYHDIPPGELFVITHPMYFQEHGCNVYLAAAVKKEVKTPVACVGGITDVEQMGKIIASGQADVVALARALIADPNLPKKAAAGKTEEITPCVRCLVCMSSDWVAGTMVCTVNPRVGREFENKFMAPPPARRKRVLIAGGGPGGMQAAITTAERGHQVILCKPGVKVGKRVIIMGGGLVGCDEAIHLAMQGKDVTVVEMLDNYARDANEALKIALGIEFCRYNIKVMTNTKGKAVQDEGILFTGPEGKEVLCKADTVVCAVGPKRL
jgi:hypothetical protein